MIESIAAIGAVTIATPSASRSIDRRQKRLRWLESLNAVGLADDAPNEFVALVQSRARIGDAIALAEALRVGDAEDAEDDEGGDIAITAADVALLIAARAEQSLAVQAHIGAAAVRCFVASGE